MSLNNLGNQLMQAGRLDSPAFTEALQQLPAALTAWLLGQRAMWAVQAAPELVLPAMTRAVELAERPDPNEDPRWVSHVRQDLRRMYAELGATQTPLPGDPPAWLSTEWPESAIAAANDWLAAARWTDREAALTKATGLPAPERRSGLALLQFLFPHLAPALGQLDDLLDAAEEEGLDALLADLGNMARHQEAVQDWLATPSWETSRQALRDRPDLTDDPRTRHVLTALASSQDSDDDTRALVHQHLAILDLVHHFTDEATGSDPTAGIDHAYAVVTDPDTAADTAWQAAIDVDAVLLRAVLTAAPHLLRRPFLAPALLAVLGLLDPQAVASDQGEPLTPTGLLTAAAEQATPTQRQALTSRLRRIARRRPDLTTAIEDLTRLLDHE
jgi:hypothetical protein